MVTVGFERGGDDRAPKIEFENISNVWSITYLAIELIVGYYIATGGVNDSRQSCGNSLNPENYMKPCKSGC